MEKQYFLANNRDLITKARLREAGIEFTTFGLESPYTREDERGVLISGKDLTKVSLLGIEVTKTTDTGYRGIAYVQYQKLETGEQRAEAPTGELPKEPPAVSITSWQGDSDLKNAFKRTAAEVLSSVLKSGAKIEIRVPHGTTVDPKRLEGSDFYILLWSSPEGNNTIKPSSELWGISVDCRSPAFAATGRGIAILASNDSGYEVAELIDRRFLYVHHDICHEGTRRELIIFQKILEAAASIMALSEEEYRKKLAGSKQKIRVRNWSSSDSAKYVRETKRILLPAVAGDIELYNAGGEEIDLARFKDNKNLTIFFYASFSGNRRTDNEPPPKIWGHRRESDSYYFPYSGKGIPFYDEKTGYVVAELVDNYLFIHHNLNYYDTNNELAIYCELLKRVVSSFKMPREKLLAEYREATRCQFFNWPPDEIDFYQKLINQTILTALGEKRIEVYYRDGNKTDLKKYPGDDKTLLRFFVFTGASEADTCKLPPKLFGIDTNTSRENMFIFSGVGQPLIDPAGTVIGEIKGNNILTYFRPFNGDGNRKKIFEELLKLIGWELTAPDDKRRDRLKAIFAPLYVKACSHRINDEVEVLEKTVANGQNQVAELQKKLTDLITSLEDQRRRLTIVQQGDSDYFRKKFEAEYASIIAMKKVQEVFIDQNRRKLNVITDTLFAKNPATGKVHEIGRFNIEISLDGKSDDIHTENFHGESYGLRWLNLTRTIKSFRGYHMNAPHVFPGGIACLGATAGFLPELIANYQFAAVVDLAIGFVETVNLDEGEGAGPFITSWPLAEKG
jgi:hypothetical protein